VNPEFPIYIPSKGRAERSITTRALDKMGVQYWVVVEPQEFDDYARVIDRSKLLVLPFSNLGLGSIPARNWIWDHSISEGHKRHWILDDNILAFYRFNRNKKIYVGDGTIFKCAEDFVERYENVPMAGLNYLGFVKARFVIPPFTLNTRIYSCILLSNTIPHRWRGKYNEDTDLSIRLLKDGFCTVLFNAFLAEKTMTQRMSGGNTDDLYANGTLEKSKALAEQHPDVTTVTWKFNRWHHQVNYAAFERNLLKLKPGITIPEGTNNYGMKLVVDK
jgi:hypothetical protein